MRSVVNQHIELVPSATHGEKAMVAGTRIRVIDVYQWHEIEGKSPRQITQEFPQLTQADVHAAMAYYWDNEELLQKQMKDAEAAVEEALELHPPKLPKGISR
jgi:uncharacterized protein (DUF433 family)